MFKLLSIWLGDFVCLLSAGIFLPFHFQPDKYFQLRGLRTHSPVLSAICPGLAGYHSPEMIISLGIQMCNRELPHRWKRVLFMKAFLYPVGWAGSSFQIPRGRWNVPGASQHSIACLFGVTRILLSGMLTLIAWFCFRSLLAPLSSWATEYKTYSGNT